MRDFDNAMHRAQQRLNLKPGDIYESCSLHPVLCLGVDYKEDLIWGVSLIAGTHPISCSLVHCGVRKLTPKAAWRIKMRGPEDAESRKQVAKEKRWWNTATERTMMEWPVQLVRPRSPRKTESRNG